MAMLQLSKGRVSCTSCPQRFDGGKLQAACGDGLVDSIQVQFTCPSCGQGYYTFVPLTTFTTDDEVPPRHKKGAK